jgi:CheY-like chemotaxis protein
MGGAIGVRSQSGSGSTFWFAIILAEDKGGASRFILPSSQNLAGLRVLVVDDNEAARIIVREQLLPHGVLVTETAGGADALALLAGGALFDVAVLDFMMPEMDGVELARRIKGDSATREIALLMLTSAPKRGDEKRLAGIGFAALFSKPLSHWQLRDALAVMGEAKKSGRDIPIITQYNLAENKADADHKKTERVRFINTHILLAEDNPVNRMVATAMLQKYGCRVTPAADGAEAVNQLEQRRFDLVFMDCQMPVMDGYEATRAIRGREIEQNLAHTPIIAFTANAMKGDDEKCHAAGMDDYVPKPLRRRDLERILRVWLPPEKRDRVEAAAAM